MTDAKDRPFDEADLEDGALLDNAGVLFYFGLTRQALYHARKAGRLLAAQRTPRGFLYRVGNLRVYRDGMDPRGRASSPMHGAKP